MAGMFYSLREAAEKLNKTEEEIKEIAKKGKLREFRDGPNLLFKVDEVEALMSDTSIMPPQVPSAPSEPEPVVPFEPEPVVPLEPEPVVPSEPEPVVPSPPEPTPSVPLEQEPTVPFEQEPVVPLEQEPVVPLEPEPVVPLEQEPVVPLEPEPVVPLEQEPVVPSPPEPTPSVPLELEPTPSVPLEPEPAVPVEQEPVIPLEPEPVAPLEPEPAVPVEQEPVVPSEPEPVVPLEPELAVPSEPEPVVPLEPEPVVPSEPAAPPQPEEEEISLAPESVEAPTPASELTSADTALASEGVNVLGETDQDYQVTEDTMAETKAVPSEASLEAIEEDVSLDSFGSGSGLLDLSLQADDTSLGGILDEIYTPETGEGKQAAEPGSAIEMAAEAEQIDEFAAPQPAPMVPAMARAYIEPEPDTQSNTFGILLFLPLLAIVYTAIVAVAGFNNIMPAILEKIQAYIWYGMIGAAVIAIFIIAMAFMLSSKGPKAAKRPKAKKAKRAKKTRKPTPKKATA